MGFTLRKILHYKLKIPTFTKGKKQLSQREVELSKQLAQVRIHVERVIGLMKNRFIILKGPLPVNMLKYSDDKDVAHIDRVLTVCTALTSLAKTIV